MKLILILFLYTQTDPDSVLLKKYPKEYKPIYDLMNITDSVSLANYKAKKQRDSIEIVRRKKAIFGN